MKHLNISHIFEAAFWLVLCAILYAYSFSFAREIEIYRFGATAWPRTILALIAIAAVGQLLHHARPRSDPSEAQPLSAQQLRATLEWYGYTAGLLALPFAYMLVPQWLVAWFGVPDALHGFKLGCAAVFIGLYVVYGRANMVGSMLTLPIFFAAMLDDFGFYALAPFFVVGVMLLMGERRPRWIALIATLLVGVILFLFVSLLYVGLPSGNISPFYQFGTQLINLLQ